MPGICYICDFCDEEASCYPHEQVRMLDDKWVCEICYDDQDAPFYWKDLPLVPFHAPVARILTAVTDAIRPIQHTYPATKQPLELFLDILKYFKI